MGQKHYSLRSLASVCSTSLDNSFGTQFTCINRCLFPFLLKVISHENMPDEHVQLRIWKDGYKDKNWSYLICMACIDSGDSIGTAAMIIFPNHQNLSSIGSIATDFFGWIFSGMTYFVAFPAFVAPVSMIFSALNFPALIAASERYLYSNWSVDLLPLTV